MPKRSKYDSFYSIADGNAKCRLCDVTLPWSTTTGTNSIRLHLTRSHASEFAEHEQKQDAEKKKKTEETEALRAKSAIHFPVLAVKSFKAPMTSTIPPSLNKWDPDGERTLAVDAAIAEMIAIDMAPYAVVDRPGFSHLMKVALPQYKLKSRNYFSQKAVPQLYKNLDEKVKKAVGSAKSVSLTCDAWSSRDQNHSLISITCHFIDPETFSPKFCVLAASEVEGAHNALNYSEILTQVFEKYDVKDKIVAMTRDGASVMGAMCDRLGLESVHCYAHLLQLSVNDLLNDEVEIVGILEKTKKIVRKIRKSEVFKKIFEGVQLEEEADVKTLVQSTSVRWSSTYAMIDRFIEKKNSIEHLLIDYPKIGIDRFSDSEWETMETLRLVLKPLADVTKSIQSRFDCPASMIIPVGKMLIFKFQEMTVEGRDELLDRLLTKITRSLEDRCSKYQVSDLLKISSFLDPRYKELFFDASCKNLILSKLRTNEPDSDEVLESEKTEEAVPLSLFQKYLKRHARVSPQPTSIPDEITEEVDRYLRVPPDDNVNPYDFWKNKSEYPHLRELALAYFTIQSTSSESERLFSVAGAICSTSRNRISTDSLDKLIFCNLNLKVFGLS